MAAISEIIKIHIDTMLIAWYYYIILVDMDY